MRCATPTDRRRRAAASRCHDRARAGQRSYGMCTRGTHAGGYVPGVHILVSVHRCAGVRKRHADDADDADADADDARGAPMRRARGPSTVRAFEIVIRGTLRRTTTPSRTRARL